LKIKRVDDPAKKYDADLFYEIEPRMNRAPLTD